MIELSRIFKIITTVKSSPLLKSRAFSVIDIIHNNLRNEVLTDGYNFEDPESIMTNSELLRRITIKDYSRLYTSTIAFQNLKLMFPQDVTDIFDVEQKVMIRK